MQTVNIERGLSIALLKFDELSSVSRFDGCPAMTFWRNKLNPICIFSFDVLNVVFNALAAAVIAAFLLVAFDVTKYLTRKI
jgi:hypothetical protein